MQFAQLPYKTSFSHKVNRRLFKCANHRIKSSEHLRKTSDTRAKQHHFLAIYSSEPM
jgi:hypothetical protein